MPKAAAASACRSCRPARWSTAKGSCSMRRTTERLAREAYAASTVAHRPHRINAHTGRADRPCSLLSLIARGVRQRAFVVLYPCQIARVEITAARLASEKVFGLTNATPVGALAEHRPAWSRFTE